VLARDAAVFEPVKFLQNAIGAVPAPLDCWLTLRGLKTLELRVQRHAENAGRIAEALAAHPAVTRVYYPGLPGHPGHEVAKQQMSGFGGMLSFELAGSAEDVTNFVSNRRFFTLGESLGGVKSLICHPARMTHASIPADQRALLAELLAHETQRVAEETCRLPGLEIAQALDVGGVAHAGREARTLAFLEAHVDAHRLAGHEDVGEDHGGVHAEAPDRLAGDFGGGGGRAHHREEVLLLAHRAVLGQVAACLAHHPRRRHVERLSLAGGEEALARGHRGLHRDEQSSERAHGAPRGTRE
jgi:hypothetical protein